MPKEAIDLELLLARISKGEIVPNKPMLTYLDQEGKEFFIFQDSGVNMLLGQEGNGKTKFLTHIVIELLRQIKLDQIQISEVIYFDTERPESQYAFSVQHVANQCGVPAVELAKIFHFFSVAELRPDEIINTLKKQLVDKGPCLIVLDHILPLVNDFNKVAEASKIDQLLKEIIFEGHIIISSIHMPYNNLTKGLGHLGSFLQRLASFILEIKNCDNEPAFAITQKKSRISARSNKQLIMKVDSDGNITNENLAIVSTRKAVKSRVSDEDVIKQVLRELVKTKNASKKTLFDLIAKCKRFKRDSSSMNTYYNSHMTDLITFSKDQYILSEKGKEYLNGKE